MTDGTEIKREELDKISGGAGDFPFNDKKTEFEKAWKRLDLDSKYSGTNKAAIYKEWEINDYQPSAYDFLKGL